jgi:hypothetical protein
MHTEFWWADVFGSRHFKDRLEMGGQYENVF